MIVFRVVKNPTSPERRVVGEMVEFSCGRVVCKFYTSDTPDAFPDAAAAARYLNSRNRVAEVIESYDFLGTEGDDL